jgi:leucyl-tRNA synthetase
LVHKWAGVKPSGVIGAEEATTHTRALRRKTHQTIKRVGDSLETLQFNTPVAALMELANAIGDFNVEPADASSNERTAVKEALTALVVMLTPFAPHTGEELYSALTGTGEGVLAQDVRFPAFSEELAKEDEVEIPVQVNGKLRSRISAPPDASNDVLQTMALADEKIVEFISEKEIAKIVVVPGRLVNIVIRG